MTISNSMAALSALAAEQARIEDEIILKEAELAQLKKQLSMVAEERLPELMEELDIDVFETKDGLKVDVKETIHAHISKANRDAAFEWLREHGHGSLIKIRTDMNVHSSTLRAFVKELLENGEDFPQELLGVYRKRKAKVKLTD